MTGPPASGKWQALTADTIRSLFDEISDHLLCCV